MKKSNHSTSNEVSLEGLWPHQVETYNFGLSKDAVFCTSSPGVGKSLPHAKIAETLLKQGQCSRILIICPKTLMHTTWKHEFETYCAGIEIAIAEAPEKNRVAAFESSAPVVIINTDATIWLNTQKEKWLEKVLGTTPLLIVDESATFKNPTAKRTKAILKLSRYFTRRYLLTGTPAPNSMVELWAQLYVLDRGARLGPRYTAFRNFIQYPISRGPFTLWVDKPEAAQIVHGLVKDIVVHHEFDDVMTQVPALKEQVVFYELADAHRTYYKRLEKDALIEYRNKTVTAVNAGSLANKLLQLASGAVYSGESEWLEFDRGRYELIAELVAQRQHTIVFFNWFHQRIALEEEFRRRDISFSVIDGTVNSSAVRANIIQDFQGGQYQAILLQPLSSAHGVTLTQADTVIWSSPIYQGDIYKQGIARIKRGVQRKHTQSIVVLAKGTRDEHCFEVFTGKKNRIDALNELLNNAES